MFATYNFFGGMVWLPCSALQSASQGPRHCAVCWLHHHGYMKWYTLHSLKRN